MQGFKNLPPPVTNNCNYPVYLKFTGFGDSWIDILVNHFLTSSMSDAVCPEMVKAEWPLLRDAVFEVYVIHQ